MKCFTCSLIKLKITFNLTEQIIKTESEVLHLFFKKHKNAIKHLTQTKKRKGISSAIFLSKK